MEIILALVCDLQRGRLSGMRHIKEVIQKDMNTDFWEAGAVQQAKVFRRAQLTVVCCLKNAFNIKFNIKAV